MRFFLVSTLLSCVTFSAAHIASISGPATYTPGSHSNYPLTFNTADSPITNEDFSVAIGLNKTSTSTAGLGTFIHSFDLENTGHGSSLGSFTLNVPLPKSRFNSGSGDYVIKAAVTNANGAEWNVQLNFFTTTVTVTGV